MKKAQRFSCAFRFGSEGFDQLFEVLGGDLRSLGLLRIGGEEGLFLAASPGKNIVQSHGADGLNAGTKIIKYLSFCLWNDIFS